MFNIHLGLLGEIRGRSETERWSSFTNVISDHLKSAQNLTCFSRFIVISASQINTLQSAWVSSEKPANLSLRLTSLSVIISIKKRLRGRKGKENLKTDWKTEMALLQPSQWDEGLLSPSFLWPCWIGCMDLWFPPTDEKRVYQRGKWSIKE